MRTKRCLSTGFRIIYIKACNTNFILIKKIQGTMGIWEKKFNYGHLNTYTQFAFT